jgi:hypothetical protein
MGLRLSLWKTLRWITRTALCAQNGDEALEDDCT